MLTIGEPSGSESRQGFRNYSTAETLGEFRYDSD
jgi:hypothetical protein